METFSDEQVRDVLLALQPSGGRPHGEDWARCSEQREAIQRWLAQGLRLTKIRKLLARQGVSIGCPTLLPHAVPLCRRTAAIGTSGYHHTCVRGEVSKLLRRLNPPPPLVGYDISAASNCRESALGLIAGERGDNSIAFDMSRIGRLRVVDRRFQKIRGGVSLWVGFAGLRFGGRNSKCGDIGAFCFPPSRYPGESEDEEQNLREAGIRSSCGSRRGDTCESDGKTCTSLRWCRAPAGRE
jgi:hypothetical protein